MAKSLRQQVWDRANSCCEYCGLPQELTVLPHEVDHIRSLKHDGQTTSENLALACFQCNSFKGANVAGYDPMTDTLQPLFNPRKNDWQDHFEWNGVELLGKTAIGRTTIAVLRINHPDRVETRRSIDEAGAFHPTHD